MKKGFLGSVATLITGAGLVFGQMPTTPATPMASGSPGPGAVSAPEPLPGHFPGPDTSACGDSDGHPCLDKECFPCGRDPYIFWFSGEYLLWWIKDAPLPKDLVLTGSPKDAVPGALGQPHTNVLFGDSDLSYGPISGFRLAAGTWLDCKQIVGLEASGFLLSQQSKNFAVASDGGGDPVLAFRYLGLPSAGSPELPFLASFPHAMAGNLGVFANSQLWGADANMVFGVASDCNFCLRLIGGFRYVDLRENLDLVDNQRAIDGGTVTFIGAPFGPPSTVSANDHFGTSNKFFGGQLGAAGEINFGHYFVGFNGKVALGGNHEAVTVAGSSTLNTPGLPTFMVPGGQFAVASNMGRFTHDEFAVVPEGELKIGCQVSRFLRLYVGYDFMYWSRVVRPGSQVDLVVDVKQVPIDPGFNPTATGTFPRPLFQHTDFWAQGIDFGMEFKY